MMFDKSWFLKNQRLLLWLANTQYGKGVMGHGLDKVDLILPNAVYQRLDKNIKAEFRTHNKYSKRLFYKYNVIWKAFHWFDKNIANIYVPKLNLGFDTFYPDANPESTSVDGFVRRQTTGEDWATIRGGVGTASGDTNTDFPIVYIEADGVGSSDWIDIIRGILLFDTSSIPDGAIVTAATFSLFVNSKRDVFGQNLGVVASTPTSNTALVNADYSQLGTTRYASDIDVGVLTASAYNDWVFNAAGIAAVSLTG